MLGDGYMKYYTIINEYHDCSCACLLEINWNVEQITKTSTAEGFIVQKFTRKLTPHNILSVNEYCDISYFEAWRVKNGRVYYEDNNIKCDDRFCIGNPLNTSNEFFYSLDTKGHYVFSGEVFWIETGSSLYNIVDGWKIEGVKQAGKLKSSEEFDAIKTIQPLFEREKFIHSWDLSTPDKIYTSARDSLFHLCPNKTERDRSILLANLEAMFNDQYPDIQEKIICEWENL